MKSKYSLFVMIITFVCCIVFPKPIFADKTEYHVYVNGKEVNFEGNPPIKEDGRILVPLRPIFEAIGVEITWDSETQTIRSTKGNSSVELTINSSMAYINGRAVSLDVPARIFNESTYVPLRFVGESWDLNVRWSQDFINGPERIRLDYIPVILIHGILGDEGSMDYLFNYLQPHANYRATVSIDKSVPDLSEIKKMYKNGRNVIKLMFKDNKQSVATQMVQLDSVIEELFREIGYRKVNLVGHSMGGLMSTCLVVENKKGPTYVNKVVTIASPINGVKSTPEQLAKIIYASKDMVTDTPRILKENVENFGFPSNIPFLSIAATEDKYVPEESALYIRNFTDNIITNSYQAGHTDIQKRFDLAEQIGAFLMIK